MKDKHLMRAAAKGCIRSAFMTGAVSLSSNHPLTPPKGERMPDTKEYWEKFTAMQDELIMEQKEEISRLKQDKNKLLQKLKKSMIKR